MRIKTLKLNSWKGVSTEMAVAPLNLLVGPNGSGKSGRMDAIQYAITGTTSLGATADDAEALVGPGGGGVSVETDGGFAFSRNVRRDHTTGAVKTTPSVRGESIGPKDADARIKQECGCYAPMFDIGEFLGLSPDRRRDAVMDLCGTGGTAKVAEIRERLMVTYLELKIGIGTVTEYFKGHAGAARRAGISELLDRIGDTERKAANQILDAVSGAMRGDTTTALSLALSEAKTQISLWRRAHDENTQAARKLAEEHAGVRVAAESLDVLRERLSVLSGERDTLKEQITKHDAWQRQAELSRRSAIMAEAKAAEAETALVVAKREAERVSGIISQAEEAEARRAAIVVPKPIDDSQIDDARKLVRKREEENQTGVRLVSEATSRKGEAERVSDGLAAQVGMAKDNPWRKAAQLLGEAVSSLGVHGAGSLMALADHINAQLSGPPLATLTAEFEQAQKRFEATDAELKVAVASANQAMLVVIDQREFCDGLLDARNRRQDEILQARDQVRELELTAIGMRHQAAQLQELLIGAIGTANEATQRSLEANRRLDAAHAEAGNINREVAAANLEACELQIGTLNEQIQTKTGYAAVEAELLACKRKAEEGMVAHDTAKLMEKAVKALRDELMAELIAPLVSRMNRFLASTGKGAGVMARLENARGKPTLDLEWTLGDKRIPLDALSGGESVLFFSALAYALTTLADPPLKVLMIEAAELDEANLLGLVVALDQASDDIGNIIVATHREDIAPAGWNVVECQTVQREGVGV